MFKTLYFISFLYYFPKTNNRSDDYGGPIESRVRLHIRVVERIKRELGRSYPVFYRLGAKDMLPRGLTLDEEIKAAR